MEGTGTFGTVGGNFGVGGCATEGGRCGVGDGKAVAAADFGEDGAAGFAEDEGSERGESDAAECREGEGKEERVGVPDDAGCILGDLGSGGEDGADVLHGGERGGKGL